MNHVVKFGFTCRQGYEEMNMIVELKGLDAKTKPVVNS
jgi:hypothetical protein